MTSDAKTIVCYHPAADIPYEFTQVRDYLKYYLFICLFPVVHKVRTFKIHHGTVIVVVTIIIITH